MFQPLENSTNESIVETCCNKGEKNQPSGKLSYQKPKIIMHGHINKITLGMSGSMTDGISPNPRP